jgi:hypothetical protein
MMFFPKRNKMGTNYLVDEIILAFHFRVRPSVWSVLDTIGHQNLHLFTSHGSPRFLSSSLFCLLLTQKVAKPPTKERELTEHFSHW